MLDRIRRIFSKPEAKQSEESRAFITNLAASDIWILAVGLRGVPAVPMSRDRKAFEIIAAYRIDVSAVGDEDSVFPFNCEWNGRQTFPFFSSEERARHFSADSGFNTDLSLFQPYRLRVGFVATPDNDMFDLILDPRSPAERRLTKDERLLLRTLTTPA